MTQHTTQEQTAPPSRPRRAVYRLFNEAGELLYVGSTKDPEARWARHRSDKAWWPEVNRREVEWHGNDAWGIETEAIREERPKYNIHSTPEHNVLRSARQQRNAAQQRVKCKVAYEANRLRNVIAAKLVKQFGYSRDRAVAEGMLVERAYKEASGAFPNGISYPSLEHIAKGFRGSKRPRKGEEGDGDDG